MLKLLKDNYIYLSIFIVWLFHISAVIGVTLGYEDWFFSKTPANLLVQTVLLIFCFPINSIKKCFVFIGCFLVGMLIEGIGVQNSFLFGSYYYGENLGPKIFNVPLLIGVNWGVLVFITAVIADRLFKHLFIKIVAGALLMVSLDFVMETVAPQVDFWYFTQGHPPLRNFVTWFMVAAFLHFIFHFFKLKGNAIFVLNLFIAQLLFFTYFYFYL